MKEKIKPRTLFLATINSFLSWDKRFAKQPKNKKKENSKTKLDGYKKKEIEKIKNTERKMAKSRIENLLLFS